MSVIDMSVTSLSISLADLRGATDACTRSMSKFFQFHRVFGKFWQNRMLVPLLEGWRRHLGEILDPPLDIAPINCL